MPRRRRRRRSREASVLEAVTDAAPEQAGLFSKIKSGVTSSTGKKALGSIAAFYALEQLLGAANRGADRGVQREALQLQGGTTAEDLYYQAALPEAQMQEAQARQALVSQLSGGVLGPSLARGERQIGG